MWSIHGGNTAGFSEHQGAPAWSRPFPGREALVSRDTKDWELQAKSR